MRRPPAPAAVPAPHPGLDLDRLLDGGSTLGLGDGALLDRVAAGTGPAAEGAFEALVGRHGPMVTRVCRGVLGDTALAEDAAQAVFLVLLRRARSIGDPARLAPWLHGVALRTARAARRQHRRHALDPIPPEAPTMTSTAPDPTAAALARERAEILHAAIARLPHRYRAPVVLCDLEGLTHAEAAQRLDCPTATVSIRLKRARERLRAGLARHRLDLDSALPPVALGVAPRALAATATAQILARQVLGVAALAKWKSIAAAAFVAGLAAVGSVAAPPARQDPPSPAGARPDTPAAAVAPQDPPPAGAPRADPPRRGALRIAKLQTTGDWNLAPRAIPNLFGALNATRKTNTQADYRELVATDPNLIHYPLIYLQDRLPLAFGAADRDALRRHLVAGGGTLLADAAGGDVACDTSFRRFIADLLPDAKLEPIPSGDALYSGTMHPLSHDLADVRRTVAAGGAVGYPDLEGVKLNGRWAIIYSKLDIGSALQGEAATNPRGSVLGYTPESATRIATNVVIYATLPVIPPPPNGVIVGPPVARDVTDYEQYSSHLAASRTVEVRAQHDGTLLEARVAEGDVVEAGQTLFRIKVKGSGETDSNSDVVALRRRAAEAKSLVDKIHAATQGQGDPAEDRARQKFQALSQELRALEAQGVSVRAPFAGQVDRRLLDVGAMVEAGKTPLATIVAVDPFLVEFEMDERTFLKIRRWLRTKPGTTHLPVRVQLNGEEGFPHQGRVLVQTGRFDPQKGTCVLHAELPNSDPTLIPGLSATIRVEYGDPRPALLIPVTALRKHTSGIDRFGQVMVVEDGVARFRNVRVGLLHGELREVGGIDATTRIILRGGGKFADGDPVPGLANPPAK